MLVGIFNKTTSFIPKNFLAVIQLIFIQQDQIRSLRFVIFFPQVIKFCEVKISAAGTVKYDQIKLGNIEKFLFRGV